MEKYGTKDHQYFTEIDGQKHIKVPFFPGQSVVCIDSHVDFLNKDFNMLPVIQTKVQGYILNDSLGMVILLQSGREYKIEDAGIKIFGSLEEAKKIKETFK